MSTPNTAYMTFQRDKPTPNLRWRGALRLLNLIQSALNLRTERTLARSSSYSSVAMLHTDSHKLQQPQE